MTSRSGRLRGTSRCRSMTEEGSKCGGATCGWWCVDRAAQRHCRSCSSANVIRRPHFVVGTSSTGGCSSENHYIRPTIKEMRGDETPSRATDAASRSTNAARRSTNAASRPAIPLGKASQCLCSPTNDMGRPVRAVCALARTRWRSAHGLSRAADTV